MARLSLRRLGERADLSVPRGSPQMGARYDADAFGRFAEGMARFLGTGRFIVGQTVLVVAWIILNTIGAIKHWDPYPFILLNLAFSTQAAYAAPLILLAQNRQDDRDRANIERDREVAARTQADTEFLARELSAVRLALADMVTTQDLEDSLSRLAKLIVDQPLPDGRGPLTPSDKELPRPGDQVIRRAATVVMARARIRFPLWHELRPVITTGRRRDGQDINLAGYPRMQRITVSVRSVMKVFGTNWPFLPRLR